MTLVLPTDLREAMVEHAREGAPEEVVGVLAGHRGGDESLAERHYPAENAASAPEVRYEIAPAEELELLERVDGAGLDVVGFYHSHPDGPLAPSETDARLAAWPRYSYVIVSPGERRATGTSDDRAGSEASREIEEPKLGSWRWTGESFEREAVEIR